MLAMFPDHTTRHYGYLHDSQPQLVPHLDIEQGDVNLGEKKAEAEGEKWYSKILKTCLSRLLNLIPCPQVLDINACLIAQDK